MTLFRISIEKLDIRGVYLFLQADLNVAPIARY